MLVMSGAGSADTSAVKLQHCSTADHQVSAAVICSLADCAAITTPPPVLPHIDAAAQQHLGLMTA